MAVDSKISRDEFARVYGDSPERAERMAEDFAALDRADGVEDNAIDLASDAFSGIEDTERLAELLGSSEVGASSSAIRLRAPEQPAFNQAVQRLGITATIAGGPPDAAARRAAIADGALNIGIGADGSPRYEFGEVDDGWRIRDLWGADVTFDAGLPTVDSDYTDDVVAAEINALLELTRVNGQPDPELVAFLIDRLETVPREHRRYLEHILEGGSVPATDSPDRRIHRMVDDFGDQALALAHLFSETPLERSVADEIIRTTAGWFTEEDQLNQELAAVVRRHTHDGAIDRSGLVADLRGIAASYALRPSHERDRNDQASLNGVLNDELWAIMGIDEYTTQGILYPDGAAAATLATLSGAYAEHNTMRFVTWLGTVVSGVEGVDGDDAIDALQQSLTSPDQVGALVWNYLQMTEGGEWSETTPIIPPAGAAFPRANIDEGLRRAPELRNRLVAHFRMPPDQVARLDAILGVGPASFDSEVYRNRYGADEARVRAAEAEATTAEAEYQMRRTALGLSPEADLPADLIRARDRATQLRAEAEQLRADLQSLAGFRERRANPVYLHTLPGMNADRAHEFQYIGDMSDEARAAVDARARAAAAAGLREHYGEGVPEGSFAWVVNSIDGNDGGLARGQHFVWDGAEWLPVFEVGTEQEARDLPRRSAAYVQRIDEDRNGVAYGQMVRIPDRGRPQRLDRDAFNFDRAMMFGSRYADASPGSDIRFPAPGETFGYTDYYNTRIGGYLDASIGAFLATEVPTVSPPEAHELIEYSRQITELANRLETAAATYGRVGNRRFLETTDGVRRERSLDALRTQLRSVESQLNYVLGEYETALSFAGHSTQGGRGLRSIPETIAGLQERRVEVARALAAIDDLSREDGDSRLGDRLHELMLLREDGPENYYTFGDSERAQWQNRIGYLADGPRSGSLYLAAQVLAQSGTDREQLMREFLTHGYTETRPGGAATDPFVPRGRATEYRTGLGAREPISEAEANALEGGALENAFLERLLGPADSLQSRRLLERAISNYENVTLNDLRDDTTFLGTSPDTMLSEAEVLTNMAQLPVELSPDHMRLIQLALQVQGAYPNGDDMRTVLADSINVMTPDEQAAFMLGYNAIAARHDPDSPDAFMELQRMLGPENRAGNGIFDPEVTAAIQAIGESDLPMVGWPHTHAARALFRAAGEAREHIENRKDIEDIMRGAQSVLTRARYDASEEAVDAVTQYLYWQRATVLGEATFMERTTTGIESRYDEYIAAAARVRALEVRIEALDPEAANSTEARQALHGELEASLGQLEESAIRLRSSFDDFWGQREELLEIYGEVAMAPIGIAGLVVTGGASGVARVGVKGAEVAGRLTARATAAAQAASRTRRLAFLSIGQAAHPRQWAYAGLARATAMSVGGVSTQDYREHAIDGALMYGSAATAFVGLARILGPTGRFMSNRVPRPEMIPPSDYPALARSIRGLAQDQPGVAAYSIGLNTGRIGDAHADLPPEFYHVLRDAGISPGPYRSRVEAIQSELAASADPVPVTIGEIRTAALLSMLADGGLNDRAASALRNMATFLEIDAVARGAPGSPRSPFSDPFSGTLRSDLTPAELETITRAATAYRDQGAQLVESARPVLGTEEGQAEMLAAQASFRDAYVVFRELSRATGSPDFAAEATVMGMLAGPRGVSEDAFMTELSSVFTALETGLRREFQMEWAIRSDADGAAPTGPRIRFDDLEQEARRRGLNPSSPVVLEELWFEQQTQFVRQRVRRDLEVMHQAAAISEAHRDALLGLVQ